VNQCPHCGDCFDDETFDAHLHNVARVATREQVVGWLYRLAPTGEEALYAR
jgi:hypothetical protein